MKFAITATVAAGDKQMIASGSSFRISGFQVYAGMEPVKATPSVVRIKPGKRATIRLIYQVTADAGDFSLLFEGGRPIPFQVNGSTR
jgi:P pilus assembly chaperone PapD